MSRRLLVHTLFRTALPAAALFVACQASAQEDAARRAAAQAFFDEAQQLLKVRDFARACPKLEEVNNLQPGKIGAMMELAACYEAWGKTASAWARYRTAADLATKAGDARKKEAEAKVTALAPQVPRLVVVVPDSMRKEPGLTIETDGVPLGPAGWGTAVPVDPGPHEVAASAPNKRKWSTKVEINRPGDTFTVTIPALTEDGSGAATSPTPPTAAATSGVPASSPWSGQRIGAVVTAGVGLVGIGVGVGLVVAGTSKYEASDPHCDDRGQCNAEGFQLRNDAIGFADAANVAFIVGGAALGGAVALWLTAPGASDAKSSTALLLGPGSLTVTGSF